MSTTINLNREQKRAVEAIEGPVMVLAGPGTGKTQVLTMRIANILKKTQMDPWNILCLTFTESAVVAMRTRLIAIIGPVAYQVRIHTFHSFCNEVMQEYPEKFSRARDWDVLSDVEGIDMFLKIIDDLPGQSPLKPFGNPHLYLPDLMSNVQQLKQEDITPLAYVTVLKKIVSFTKAASRVMGDFFGLAATTRTDATCHATYQLLIKLGRTHKLSSSLAAVIEGQFETYQAALIEAEDKRQAGKARTKFKNDLKRWFEQLSTQLPKQQELARAYKAYQAALAETGRYDYADMITMVVERFKTDDQLLARYQEQFQYILVDEYQDTNGAQNETVRLLGSWDDQPNIFVVGDDKQSIYRFQGASLNNMLSFYENYKQHIIIISLQENYRSTQIILDAAQAVIGKNRESITKYIIDTDVRLMAAAKQPERKLIAQAFAAEEIEDSWVAQQCLKLIKGGIDAGEIAVLYRTNQDGTQLLQMMQRLGVPARLEIGENVLNDRRIQQWLTLLGYLDNIHRDELLAEILHYPWWGIDSLDVLRVIHYAGQARLSLLSVIMSERELKKSGVAKPDYFLRLAKLLADWRVAAANTSLQNFLDIVVAQSGWLDYVLRHHGDVEVVHRLNALLNEAKLQNQSHPNFSLADFMQHLKILREHKMPLAAALWQASSAAVHLMTAHRAKGAEFRHVFITRLTDKHWGNRREWNKVPLPQGLVRYDYVVAQEHNEDERRLFYVALTRAKERVYLTHATHNLAGRQLVPAVFLAEIPAAYINATVFQEKETQAVERLQKTVLAPLPIYSDQGVKNWLTQQLANHVMSVTHLNNYLECPRLFYFRNLLRVPEAKTVHLAFGTAVHRALHDWFELASTQPKLPPAKFLLSRFSHHLKREALPKVQLKDSLAMGNAALTDYYATYHKMHITDTLLEYNFASHGVQLDSIPLTGKLDKIEIMNSDKKLVNVVDYKSGNPDNSWAYLKPGGKYHRQLVFYKLLTELSQRFDYEMISGEIDFIQPSSRIGKHVKKKIEVTAADLEELKSTIKKVWSEIQALKFLDESAGCGQCQFCRAV